uniref:Coiled-coil domain-containing protein 124 n=1 Tax=Ascaris suum TaxID=6253 RepID=F1L8X6_ASCSU
MERKRQEAAQRRQENRLAYDEEMNSLVGKATSSTKVTQAAIEAAKRLEEERRKEEEKERLLREKKIEAEREQVEENVNRLEVEGESARSVSEAIKVLSMESPTVDRHPEKRLKAAYQAFEERMLPRLKEEHPTFRLSQLKQLLKKEWQKSPDNPLNQKILSIIQ